MEITKRTKIKALLDAHPELEAYLVARHDAFKQLADPVMRRTMGRIATVEKAAALARIDPDDLVSELNAKVAGAEPSGAGADRRAKLKTIIRELHDGAEVEEVKERFAELVRDVDASEISQMEQSLIEEGLPVEEVQRLCDVHVRVFEDALDAAVACDVPQGHPIDTYRRENRALERVLDRIDAALAEGARIDALCPLLDEASLVDVHYTRKENQLFPHLERHGISGPSQVMWSIHDDIRARLKTAREEAAAGDAAALGVTLPETVRMLRDMVYKEENILFPTALEALDGNEWDEMRAGEHEVGFAWIEPPAPVETPAGTPSAAPADAPGELPLTTGALSLEQVDLMLRHLPVDITFVDHEDRVRYYSEGDRIFPRSPGVIGRAVHNCHPPKSVQVVERIVDAFRDGERDSAEFWIRLDARLVYIRYFAVRDEGGGYRGVIEVSQDVTGIRELEGERRLLDWDAPEG